eukprot:TRINITY_DN58325_c0_g1_i1.p1 TRINITY_DN58325_c0_g1~~TRINITY_DN58325_c0_g1_i1.p1  ORF type:complete len:141 (+),score=28.27 TRINITY_DN58325_c0_g1_i1:124-546(+)
MCIRDRSRIQGRIVVIGVQGGERLNETIHHSERSGWKVNSKMPFGSDVPVSIPEPVWHKMCELYKTFGEDVDTKKFSNQFNVDVQQHIRIPESATSTLKACDIGAVSYTHLRAHETPEHLVCRLLLEKKKNRHNQYSHYL